MDIRFLTRLEFVFTVHFTEEEIAYLAIHILGGKFRYQDEWERNKLNVSNPVLSQVVSHLIGRMSKLNEIDFGRIHFTRGITDALVHDIKSFAI